MISAKVRNTGSDFTGKQEEFKRSEVQIAPYNPRKISPQQKATLKRSIRKYGVVGGITVNKQTMTIVGGNQKVTIVDEIMGYPEKDYTLLAEAVNMDYKTEVELNFMLNSENAHGEWDDMKVRELLPDINYMDAGLTEEDLSLFGYDAMVKTEGEDELGLWKTYKILWKTHKITFENLESYFYFFEKIKKALDFSSYLV
jgi:hypothetical protein